MRPWCLVLSAVLLLPAGCGGTLYLALKGRPSQTPVEVFDCVRREVRVLGYSESSVDVEDHRVTARKYDPSTRLADTKFRRMIDRLSIEIASPADGGTRLSIDAHTFAELMTQRGTTEVEQSASPAVTAAARTLLEKCGG